MIKRVLLPVSEDVFTTEPMVDTGGRRITQRRLYGSLGISVTASAFGMVWVAAALGVPATMFMEALDAPGVLIGAVVTVQQLAMVMQIPSALFAERLPTRKAFWGVVATLHRLVWFVPALLPFLLRDHLQLAAAAMVATVGLSAMLGHAASASWFSWMADLVPDNIKGRFWGRRQSVTMFAFLIGTAIVGAILDRFPDPREPGGSFNGFVLVFCLAAIFGTIDILIHCLVPEPVPDRRPPPPGLWRRLSAPLRDHDFLWLTLAFGAWAFAVGLVGSFGMIYLRREFGVTYVQLTAIAISSSIGTVLSGPVWGRMMDRIGTRTFGAIMLAVAPLFGGAWFLVADSHIPLALLGHRWLVPQPVFVIFFSSLAAGAFYSGVGLCQLNLSGVLAPRQGRTLAMAVHWTLVGLLGAGGPILGGYLMDLLSSYPPPVRLPSGAPASFLHVLVIAHAAIIWLVVLPLLVRIRKRGGELSLRCLVGNPLRAVGTVQNILALEASVSHVRVRAANSLGAGKAVAATQALIGGLEDASPAVRQASVEALGRIGTAEAVSALLGKLGDPEADLDLEIIRAWRGSRDPRLVEPLLACLRGGDRQCRAESARTLGTLGAPQVAGDLLATLRETDDSTLAYACLEALVELRQPEALADLVRLMKRAAGESARRSLALLLARMVGDAERFYELLNEEERAPGSQVVNLFTRLRRHCRRLAARPGGADVSGLLASFEEAYEGGEFGQAAAALPGLLPLLQGEAEEMFVAAGRDPWQAPDASGGVPVDLLGGRWFVRLAAGGWAGVEGLKPVDRVDVLLALHFLTEHLGAATRKGSADSGSLRSA